MKRPHSTRETPNKRPRVRGHVLRSVQRPVHVTPVRTRCSKGIDLAGRSRDHRGRANPREWEEPTPGVARPGGNCTARRASPLTHVRERDASETEGGHGHRPCEESRARSSWPVRRGYVAEVVRQHPGLEYARTQRSKKGGGTSERGPSKARVVGREPCGLGRANGWSGESALTRAQ